MADNPQKNEEFIKLINNRIELLRPKLLDLTRRNPLLSTKFKEPNTSLVRIVDVIPSFLFDNLVSNKVRIAPLPPLEEDPRDELSREFQNSLVEARLSNEIYLRELEQIKDQDENGASLLIKAERSLKDRIRQNLNMPSRQTKTNLLLDQHALNHNIRPDYELLQKNDQCENERHFNSYMQTLLLPDILEKRLNALYMKDRIYKEEIGINVLHAAFGFLEWQETPSSPLSWAPLVLLPVEIGKKRTRSGQEFWVSANEATPEGNTVLAEKLRLEFDILIPEYKENQPIDVYLEQVANQKPKGMSWRVRNWVVIGVFPSVRMAMYHDLGDAMGWDFAGHSAISSLFGGSDNQYIEMPFGEEYDIDEPEIESKVPLLVTDADSSQYSIIVDIADGKNLSVEGPPGTGKSQTIVNTIAAALVDGKKILFVAEKTAALEVVRSRLEAFGLGHFLLPLQATRASKEQIITSIRERIEMAPCIDPMELDNTILQFRKTRDEIKSYIQILSSSFGETGLKVYEIIGEDISLRDLIENLSTPLKNYRIPEVKKLTISKFEEIIQFTKDIQEVWTHTKENKKHWKEIGMANIDFFKAEKILNSAEKTASKFVACVKVSHNLKELAIDPETPAKTLLEIKSVIKSFPEEVTVEDIELTKKLSSAQIIEQVNAFLEVISDLSKKRSELEEFVKDPFHAEMETVVSQIITVLNQYNITDLTHSNLSGSLSAREKQISAMKETLNILYKIFAASEVFKPLPVKIIILTCELVGKLSREALMLRHPNFQDFTVQTIIQKAESKAKTLCIERLSLKDKFVTLPLTEAENLSQYSSTVSQSVGLSFLSSHYRAATRFYKKISARKNFNKKTAVDDLNELNSWVKKNNEYNSDQVLKDLLGVRFNGIDTVFEPYIEVCNYFTEIDKKFAGAENIALRALLRSGDKDILLSLPNLTSSHLVYQFLEFNTKMIEEQLEDFETEFAEFKSAIEYIEKARDAFCNLEDLTLETLEKVSTLLKAFTYGWNTSFDNSLMQELLGERFKGGETHPSGINISLQLAINLQPLEKDIQNALLQLLIEKRLTDLNRVIDAVLSAYDKALSDLKEIGYLTDTDPKVWYKNKTYQEIADHMHEAAQDKKGLMAFSRLVSATEELSNRGYRPFIKEILASYSSPCNISKIFRAIFIRGSAEEIYKEYGIPLVRFNGIKLSSLRRQLAEQDRHIIKLSRQRVQALLYKKAKPPEGNGRGGKSTFTEMALLKNEITKKQCFASMRDIVIRAGEALREIKPCWMMSPLAVAQYIPKGTITFDLVIIDEASQMPPEDALGALVRANQVMVVGDTNQLPPTSFFHKILEDDELDEDQVVTEESILEMANATFKPRRRLRWHYRSRHSGLIAFSNQHIYQNNLVVFPSPNEDDPSMGVFYNYVEDGLYSSGINPEEAKVMVEATLEFMAKYPDLSLGIVTLNHKQQHLLVEEMQNAFDDPDSLASKYKDEWEKKKEGLEPFFIKNLENVQGDERDVIFISTVYGRKKAGAPVMQRFGPINGIAGKRRLNVLFSRAKKKIVTFSSMTSNDIQAEEGDNPGVYMLKRWLEYCANDGRVESGKLTNAEPGSPFECHVIEQIRSIGCEAIPQVGVSGYSIDIGVRHPDWPHGFIMGVECDGATYHSSKSARDRDRLRQEVLEELGWHLYRIWSTDWFEDPRRETQKLREAIEQRMADLNKGKQSRAAA